MRWPSYALDHAPLPLPIEHGGGAAGGNNGGTYPTTFPAA